MKNLLLTISVALVCVACSEDSIINSQDLPVIDEDQAHISVHVVVEDPEAKNGGCIKGTYVHNVEGAEVSVYYLDEERPISANTILMRSTDKDGIVKFEDLPKGNFKVSVVSSFGTEQHKLTTSLGKLTKVYIRF